MWRTRLVILIFGALPATWTAEAHRQVAPPITPDYHVVRLEPWVYPGQAELVRQAGCAAIGAGTVYRTSPTIDHSPAQIILTWHTAASVVGQIPPPETVVWPILESADNFAQLTRPLRAYVDARERRSLLVADSISTDRVRPRTATGKTADATPGYGYFPAPGLGQTDLHDLVLRLRSGSGVTKTVTTVPDDLWRMSSAIETGATLTSFEWSAAISAPNGRTWNRWLILLPLRSPKQMVIGSWEDWVAAAIRLSANTALDADIRLMAMTLAAEWALQHPNQVKTAGVWRQLHHGLLTCNVDRTWVSPFTYSCDGLPLAPIPDPEPMILQLKNQASAVQPLAEKATLR
jgi:hypothetical protein